MVTGVLAAFRSKNRYRFTSEKLLNLRIPSGGNGIVRLVEASVVPGGHVAWLAESNGCSPGKLAHPQISSPWTCTTWGMARSTAMPNSTLRSHRPIADPAVREPCEISMSNPPLSKFRIDRQQV